MSELIEAHVRHLKAGRKAARTIKDRARVLHQLHDALPFGLAYASTDELEEFLGSNPDWQDWTVATYAMHIRGSYRWARGRYLESDPAEEMAKPRIPKCVPRPVTDEELAIALDQSPEPWRTLILLAAFAGLRASEAADVHREDVTQESIRIRRAKGGDPAAVETHPMIWRVAAPRARGPLAVRMTGPAAGKPVTGGWIFTRERRHFDRIGLLDVTMHRFRHWYGTSLLAGGADLRTVQEALRHKSITSTQGYTLVRSGQRRLAIRSLPDPTDTQKSTPHVD